MSDDRENIEVAPAKSTTPCRPLRIAVAAILVGLSVVLVDLVVYYSKLPPQVVSHFDLQGNPVSWSAKLQFVGFVLFTLALTLGTFSLIPLVAFTAPLSVLNLPNAAYWMAPEREQKARDTIAAWGLWFAAASVWCIALLFHEAIVSNFRQPPRLFYFWWLIGGYIATVLFLVFRLNHRLQSTNES